MKKLKANFGEDDISIIMKELSEWIESTKELVVVKKVELRPTTTDFWSCVVEFGWKAKSLD